MCKMELFLKLLFFFIYFGLGICYVAERDEPGDSLIWPLQYHYTGEKLILKSDIVDTFEVWYSAEENRSRIDFNGGMVKRYYYVDSEDNTSVKVYQISPITDDDVTNEMICRSVGDETTIDHLPNVTDFIYQGDQPFDDKLVQIWKSIEEDDDRIERTLYVYKNVEGVDVPVRYEKILYNVWTKAMRKHEITNFYKFKTTVNSQDLDVKKAKECKDLGNLGENLKTDLEFLHPGFSRDVDKAFRSYKKHFKKQHNRSEHEMRKAIFEENWKRVVAHNKKNLSYNLEVNKFADLMDEELRHLSGSWPSRPEATGTHSYPYSEEDLRIIKEQLPLFYDMRIDGVISPVKNQGDCSSCWSFSTVAAVEAALSRNNGGRNIDLSEQSLVDCAWSGNFGCGGGFVHRAFKYITTHGIPSQMKYGPYLQLDGYCKLENMTEVHKIKGFANVPSLSETALKAALYNFAPVSVTITATKNMELYSSGVFYDIECKKETGNHAVTVVGYGVRDGVTYWIVKNSWGEDWGQDGYILMSSTNDNCNLMSDAYYPIV